jgi:hypothetical protein
MRQRRPAKDVIRSYWADEFERHDGDALGQDVPIYLCLPGGEGLDIKYLQDRGLVGRTQVGGIPDQDAAKIIAVERSSDAVLDLQANLPGLKILGMDLKSLLRGESLTRFPDASHRQYCRARVVNLDLNAPLTAVIEDERLLYPVLVLIAKLSRLHADPPVVREWSLLLTLHGDIVGPLTALEVIRDTLAENFANVEEFKVSAMELFGTELSAWVTDRTPMRPGELSKSARALLMAFVPKRTVEIGKADGWRVRTHRNIAYPGANPSPGMASWIFHFSWDPRTATHPTAVYREGVLDVLANVEDLRA